MSTVNALSHAAIRAVQDPQARLLFQQLSDMAAVRNGDVGNGDQAFVTLGDLTNNPDRAASVARAMAKALADGVSAPGSAMQQLADQLQERILGSAAWQQLFAPVALLTAPDTTAGSAAYALLQEGKARGAAIKVVSEAVKTANENIARVSQQLVAGLADSAAAVQQEAQARASADSATASTLSTLTTQTNSNTAGITSEESARTNSDNALVNAINTLWGKVGTNTALVSGGSNVVVNNVGGAATKFDQLQATVTDPSTGLVTKYATVRNDLSVTNDTVKGISGKWGMKLDLNGYISGLLLNAGVTPDGKSESAFMILADMFAVGAPGKPNIVPFAIDAQTGLVAIRGDLVVKRSITADSIAANTITAESAVIGTAAITTANIRDAAVDTLKIQGNSVTVMSSAKGTGSASITLNAQGGGVPVFLTCSAQGGYSVRGTPINGRVRLRIKRDGLQIYETFTQAYAPSGQDLYICTTGVHVDVPAGGVRTYTFEVVCDNDPETGYAGYPVSVSAALLETKR